MKHPAITLKLLRPREAAELLAISLRQLQNLVSRHELPRIKIGRSTRFALSDLQFWIDAKQQESRRK